MMRARGSLLLLLLITGCSSAEPLPEQIQGIRTEVAILPGGFVRFEGERIPMEAFQLEMRVRARDAEGDAARLPWVVIEVAPEVGDLTGQAMVQRLMDGMQAAGIGAIELKSP